MISGRLRYGEGRFDLPDFRNSLNGKHFGRKPCVGRQLCLSGCSQLFLLNSGCRGGEPGQIRDRFFYRVKRHFSVGKYQRPTELMHNSSRQVRTRHSSRRSRKITEAERKSELDQAIANIDTLFSEFADQFRTSDPIAAVYARFSTDFQHSVVDQVRACLEDAVRKRMQVERELVFFELAISGVKLRWPGLQALQEATRRKAYAVLFVLTTNRLFRKSYKCMEFVLEQIVEPGLRAVFVKSCIDTADAQTWRTVLQCQAMIDEHGSLMYAGNIRAAHEGMFEKGWVITSLPFGYQGETIEGPLTKRMRPRQKIAICDEEAIWVRKIFHWFVHDRLPMARILEKLNTENAPANPKGYGEFWSHSALRYLLENPAYRGGWAYGKGHNVWQHKADYAKRVLRDQPLRERHFEHLRLISDMEWNRAQELLAEHAGRGGRKPKDGDRTSRPRNLNGLLICETYEVRLKVCGDRGQWMACPVCRTLPKHLRPLHTYLPRALATRKVCEALAKLIRDDKELVGLIVESAKAAIARSAQPDQGQVAGLKARLSKIKGNIRFVLANPGDTEEDQKSSQEVLRDFRAETRRIELELNRIQADNVPTSPPTEEDIRKVFEDLANLFGSIDDDAQAGMLREALELITGGKIIARQAGEKRKFKGWLQLRFHPRLIELVGQRLTGPRLDPKEHPELVIDAKEDRIAEAHADQVKELADRGLLYTRIAEMLGIERHQVADALRIWHERNGLPVPADGRQRRGNVPEANMKPTKAALLATDAKSLFDQGWLLSQIASHLNADRATIRSALRIAFDQNGETMPDGRNRRKTLELKNRPRQEREGDSLN